MTKEIKYLKTLMLELDLSQRHLAELLHIRQPDLSKVLRGDRILAKAQKILERRVLEEKGFEYLSALKSGLLIDCD